MRMDAGHCYDVSDMASPRRSQLEIREQLLELQREMRAGVTLAHVMRRYSVGRSRAHELLKEAAAIAGHKVTSEGAGEHRVYSCPDADPLRIELSESEVLPATIMLRDATYPLFGGALGSAKRVGPRLAAALDGKTKARVHELAQRVRLRFHATKSISEDAFQTIVNAMAAGCTIRFDYATGKDTPSLKSASDRMKLMKPWHAEPWAIFYARRHLYVIVRPLEGSRPGSTPKDRYSSLRTIKLNRMHEPKASGTTFRMPPWFSLDEYLDDAWDVVRFGHEPKSKVVIDLEPAAAENMIDTEWHRTQSVDRNRDGSVKLTPEGRVRFSFRVRGFNEIKYWVLSLGSFAHVVQPVALRKAVLAELELMREHHRTR